ncbi:MAG: hypothetical protein ABIZ80_10660 [Bryobacteraceae bacterium]
MTRRTALQTLAALPALAQSAQRFCGITMMPEWIQHEGIDAVLKNLLERAKATAVAISPYVLEPADEKTGTREPPIDADAGKVRLLDRSLWGKRELFVRAVPSFTPDVRLYKGLRYQPAAVEELTRRQGPVVADFIRAAKSAGLKVYFQVQSAIPPGYRVQFGGPVDVDRPRLPDGRVPPRRVANNASLASTDVRLYGEALIRDLCRAYPQIDGIRVDWPEYPPYFLDDVFLDFSDPAKTAAARLGFPFEAMRRDAGDFYKLLHGRLENRHLEPWAAPDGGRSALLEGLAGRPGLLELTRFKAVLSEELLAGFRSALTSAGGAEKELVPNAFPPPFHLASGMDYARAGHHSASISVKLYTMHWPMMLRFYGDAMLKANPGVSEKLLVQALVRWFDIADEGGRERLADWAYPEPGEPHPVGAKAQARKIQEAQASAGSTPVIALAHAYGPLDDFRRRVKVAYEAAGRRVWVNRYGYLSNAKLDAMREVCT